MMETTKKKLIGDMFLNLVSSLILTSVLQLAVYPFLSQQNTIADFGNMLTITGICNVIGIMFGVSLNNILLIKHNDFPKVILKSSFFKLTILSLVSGVLLIQLALLPFIQFLHVSNYILLIGYTILLMMRSFLTVFYRINLNYMLIVKHTVFTSLGYLVGLYLYSRFQFWGEIFFIGELFSFVFIMYTIPINIELRKQDLLFPMNKNIRNDFLNFFTASFFANLMLYLDRLLINPILGSAQVAVFFGASVIGKLLSLVMQPLSSVILSYLSKEKQENGYPLFKKTLLTSIISGIIFFVISIFITPFLIKLLYIDLYEEALSIYVICNLLAIINNISIMLQPLTLKFCPTRWQGIIQIVYFMSYFSLSMILMNYFGLHGFIIGNIISSILKVLLMILLMRKYTFIKKRSDDYETF